MLWRVVARDRSEVFYDLGSQLFLVSPNEVDPNCHNDSTSPLFLVT